MADSELVREAAAELYTRDPAEFTRRRADLAASARAAGDASAAKEISRLRKPTRSAWAVNRLVRADPGVPSRLAELGADLRSAGSSLDGPRIRELSRARRELIGALTRQALLVLGQRSAPAALQEEVTATLNAALADPQVAAELAAGALLRPVGRAGFGFVPDAAVPDAAVPTRPAKGAPAGAGGTARAKKAEKAEADRAEAERERAEAEQARAEAERERARAERERRRQAIAAAEQALTDAEQAAEDAEAAERERAAALRQAEQQLAEARKRLAEAELRAREARTAQRNARRALGRLRG
ncbi:MAG TPA: hypothetical protein VE733_20730 [Streptosporangiaceae bacterium]|nr:hypothetical protein [Streptosporangiaceae bacterium]